MISFLKMFTSEKNGKVLAFFVEAFMNDASTETKVTVYRNGLKKHIC